MTFDPTKPVQTREGLKARILCTNRNHHDGSIVALVTLPEDDYRDEREALHTYHEGGFYLRKSNGFQREDDLDLVNVPVKRSTWQNVFKNNVGAIKHYKFAGEGVLGRIRRDYEDDVFVGAEYEPL